MRKRKISSDLTIVFQVFMVIFNIGMLGGSILSISSSDYDPAIGFGIITFGTLALNIFFTFRLKKVFIDNEYMYVSSLTKIIKIHWSKIDYVTDGFFFSPRFITIRFKEKTELGKKITIIPYNGFMVIGKSSMVKEIESFANKL